MNERNYRKISFNYFFNMGFHPGEARKLANASVGLARSLKKFPNPIQPIDFLNGFMAFLKERGYSQEGFKL